MADESSLPGKDASVPSKSKGKGKATDKSLSTRLQQSSKLALQAAFGNDTQSPGSFGHEKGQGSAGVRYTESQAGASASSQAAVYSDRTTGRQPAIRTLPSASHKTTDEFNLFMRTSALEANATATNIPHQSVGPPDALTVAQQKATDGADVIQLLSLPDEEPNYQDGNEQISTDEAERLRDALFPPGQEGSNWIALLDFMPSFTSESAGLSVEAKQYLGTADPVEARAIWVQQWGEVLSSYTSHVWGDLGPLVEDVKREIEDMLEQSSGSSQNTDTTALERLRQILGHVRGQT